LSDETYTTKPPQRTRPRRRASASRGEQALGVLTEEFEGAQAAYGNTLLFIGYEVEGLVEITVYPRYRFGSDDRVQGHLGYVRVPRGASWEEILPEIDAIYERAQRNYRVAATLRAAELRAHGSRYESAYEEIADAFRESWHGFALRLRREGEVVKGPVRFTGRPPAPVLATWRGDSFTVMVFSTGSILVLRGDRRSLPELQITNYEL
jgi:hypothetical protein